ncbi:MAG: hypothetical protein GF346_07935 [Candidatus Eisenbacteria bacterium]|nr:hypothetical protein [Candidatus Latescibacterota bacterium]MBD3302363.1 hypothetical protein [Candidatus Eisenbacteria bacterium]
MESGSAPTGIPRRRSSGERRRIDPIGVGVRLALFLAFLYVVASAAGLKKDGTGRLVVDPPSSAGEVAANLSGISESIWTNTQLVVDPVLSAYGLGGGLALFGLLLLGIGYWIFVRS